MASRKKYKQYVDSLIDKDDNQTYIVRAISEGTIKQRSIENFKGRTHK
jgi:hypothetical protein